jgi:hypothetical protein
MTKKIWVGNTKCQFCDYDETIHHLFFTHAWRPSMFGPWWQKQLEPQPEVAISASVLGNLEVKETCIL